jgi:hypothetical protein
MNHWDTAIDEFFWEKEIEVRLEDKVIERVMVEVLDSL